MAWPWWGLLERVNSSQHHNYIIGVSWPPSSLTAVRSCHFHDAIIKIINNILFYANTRESRKVVCLIDSRLQTQNLCSV